MDAWLACTIDRQRRRNLMTGMIERLQHYGLWLAWRTWSRRVKEAQTQRREEEWRNDVMLRTITRIMSGMKASAFATWAGQIACHHMFSLLDKEQKTPDQDKFLVYRMKW